MLLLFLFKKKKTQCS